MQWVCHEIYKRDRMNGSILSCMEIQEVILVVLPSSLRWTDYSSSMVVWLPYYTDLSGLAGSLFLIRNIPKNESQVYRESKTWYISYILIKSDRKAN